MKLIDFMVILGNLLIICIFAGLGIYFGKWWIVLFSAFFCFSIKHSEKEDKADNKKQNMKSKEEKKDV